MWNQIRLLTKVQLLGMFGLNQVRYGKDAKKKNGFILFGVSILLVVAMMVAYVVMLTVGCIKIGMGDIVPSYALAVISIMILFFTMFKAGSILFQMTTYEMLISLPVKPVAIVISRFLNMYIMNVLMGLLVMVPVAIVYGLLLSPGVLFYVMLLLGALFMPLLPMTIATAAGAVIMGISARMRYKNLVTIILTIGFSVGILVLTFQIPRNETGLDQAALENIAANQTALENIAELVQEQIHSLYPPAVLFTEAVINKNLLAFLAFAGISVSLFLIMAYLVQRKFVSICNALSSKRTKGNYKLREMSQRSPLLALYKRELSRYFASSLYVMNTAMGPVLMVALTIGIAVTGIDKMDEMMGMPGIISRILPLLLGCLCSLNSSTTCSISMEGKQWWIAKSLPVSIRQILDSKIMVYLTIALPCYLVSEVILLIALRPGILQTFWILLMPLVYLFFSAVAGITLNLKIPVFQWESEAAVVKQGGAVFMGMIISMVVCFLPVLAIFGLQQISADAIMAATAILLAGATALLYYNNNRVDIRAIE